MLSNVALWVTCRSLLIAAAITGVCVPVSPVSPIGGRDKTGTSGAENGTKDPQACIFAGSAGGTSDGAERGGFEPPVPVSQDTAFPVPHNRPLCHLSQGEGF